MISSYVWVAPSMSARERGGLSSQMSYSRLVLEEVQESVFESDRLLLAMMAGGIVRGRKK